MEWSLLSRSDRNSQGKGAMLQDELAERQEKAPKYRVIYIDYVHCHVHIDYVGTFFARMFRSSSLDSAVEFPKLMRPRGQGGKRRRAFNFANIQRSAYSRHLARHVERRNFFEGGNYIETIASGPSEATTIC